MTRSRLLTALLAFVLLATTAAACGGDDGGGDGNAGGELSGTVIVDGSSTVAPFTTAAAEGFQRDNSGVQVTVGISGTGGGFERFCAGETDLSNASRPIKDEEKEACEQGGIEFAELQVANDALTIVVNPQNDWAECLTVEQLKAIWEPKSKVKNWNQIDPKFPDQDLKLFGPGTDSGTFDYFTDEIVGEEGASRSDYSASENDNALVQGVAGEKGGLGYFGFSYFEENQSKLRALEVDGGDGCVVPSSASAQDGTYKPLSRPLFVYAKRSALNRPGVAALLAYVLDNQASIAGQSKFVPLTDEQLSESQSALEEAKAGDGGGA